MSGRRWIFTLLAAVPISTTGCQVDGGSTKMWNRFASAKESDVLDEGELPKFVSRATDDEKEEKEQIEAPIDDGRVKDLLAEGQRALQENRLTEARQAYRDVMQLVPDDPTAHHGLAMVADLTEQWAEADDHYRHALRSRPRDANLLCDIGYSYLLQNRYSEASSYLSQAIQINPNHENSHTNLALLDLRQGNREAARQRLLQRYGNSATVTQLLTALESQSASKAATGLAATSPTIPENAAFEEIREIANRERIAAEQRRAALNIPGDHNAAIDSVNSASHTNVPGQYEAAALQESGRQSSRFGGSSIDPAMAVAPSIAGYASGNAAPQLSASTTGDPIPDSVPPQFGGISGIAYHASPLAGNQNVDPATANTGSMAGSMAGSWNQNSMPPQNPTLLQYPAIPGQANFSSQQPVSGNDTAPQSANIAPGLGGLIPVRPSGAFQPPVQGVSDGQPFGFGQQYSNPGHPNAHVQIEGLNAGPGSLFPVGQGAAHQDGTLRMENVSPPGTNAGINGAMLGQPVSTLPAQEWMMQQQQKIQQMNSQQQSSNEIGQRYSGKGYSNPQYSGTSLTGAKVGIPIENAATTATTTAPRPGNPTPPVNPLASYENQLRELDNPYNNTLQQLDRNASSAMPRAQY